MPLGDGMPRLEEEPKKEEGELGEGWRPNVKGRLQLSAQPDAGHTAEAVRTGRAGHMVRTGGGGQADRRRAPIQGGFRQRRVPRQSARRYLQLRSRLLWLGGL